MPEAIEVPFLRKLFRTPLGQLLRGRVTGNWRHRIGSAELPQPVKLLVTRVVKRTRLSMQEKNDVVIDLTAHFADALDAGVSVEEAIRDFGDERQASRLIRKAKLRNRSFFRHALHVLPWVVGLVLLWDVAVAMRFHFGEPTITVDFVAMLNEDTLRTPTDQRAWPLYERAIAQLDLDNKKLMYDLIGRRHWLLDAMPSDYHWPDLVAWTKQNQHLIELVREGARRPILGFALKPNSEGWRLSSNGYQVWPARSLNGALMADLRVAFVEGDLERILSDVDASYSLTIHLASAFDEGIMWRSGHPSLFSNLEWAVKTNAGAFDERMLRHIAHRLSQIGEAQPLVDLKFKRIKFHNQIQYSYTDDGSGNGHLISQGIGQRVILPIDNIGLFLDRRSAMMAAIVGSMAASREETMREFDWFMDEAQFQLNKPARDADWSKYKARLRPLVESPLSALKHPLLRMELHSFDHLQVAAERLLGNRDGLLVAVACESYRRKRGEYPETLDTLVPLYLPSTPIDRITGGELKYRLKDGKPLIYSVGDDRDDDQGRPPMYRGIPESHFAAGFGKLGEVYDGDWVLFPPVEPEAEADE